jgi:dolichol-phosphate mannosyltransferase
MQKKKACVVVPTYNEAENIRLLLESLETAIAHVSGYDVDIVVADDTSPDGTADIAADTANHYNNIYVVPGERKGMGAAYIRAFSGIIDVYDVFITMDADFSHPPEMIPELLKKIDAGCDVVIGSRYIKGGSAPDWPVQRRFISFTANAMARIVAGLYHIHDCTSNYRAIKTSLLKNVSFQHVSFGYGFVTTTLWAYVQQKACVCEIPLVFYDRTKGETKLRSTDIIGFFFNCFNLRLKSLKNVLDNL